MVAVLLGSVFQISSPTSSSESLSSPKSSVVAVVMVRGSALPGLLWGSSVGRGGGIMSLYMTTSTIYIYVCHKLVNIDIHTCMGYGIHACTSLLCSTRTNVNI